MWVSKLVFQIKDGTQTVGVWEQGTEEYAWDSGLCQKLWWYLKNVIYFLCGWAIMSFVQIVWA